MRAPLGVARRRTRRAASLVAVALGAVVLATTTRAGAVDPNPGVNDQPDVTIAAPVSTGLATPVALTVTVSDPDEHLLDMEMEIDISDLDGVGGRSVAAGDYGTFTWGGGTAVTSDVEVEPQATVNTMLSTFTYTPPDGFAGIARIVFEIDDQGNVGTGGVLSRTRFIDIAVGAPGDGDPSTNAQPDVTLPAPLTTATGTPVSFAPTVSDIDVGPYDMEMEIDISDLDGVGGLDVAAGDYGTFTWGGGSGVTSDVEVEPLATINTMLSTFTYTPDPGFTGLARIVFEIDDQGNTGPEFPPNVLARTRFIDITVAEGADLGLAVTFVEPVDAGTNLTYSLVLTNAGTADATSVTISSPLPPGTTFVSLAQTGGPAASLTTPAVGATGTVTMQLATLLDGASASFDVTVAVPAGAVDGSTLDLSASATATSPDPVSTDNAVADTVTVRALQATTTTTEPSSTTSTSTSTSTSLAATSTTADGAVDGEALPRTGEDSRSGAAAGVVFVLGGVGLVALARRARRRAG